MQLSLTWLLWEVVVIATRRVTNRWKYTEDPWQTPATRLHPREEVVAPSAHPPTEATCIVMLGPLTLSQLSIRSRLRVFWASSLTSSGAYQTRARKATKRTQMTSSYPLLTTELASRLPLIILMTARVWWTCMKMLQMCSLTKSRHQLNYSVNFSIRVTVVIARCQTTAREKMTTRSVAMTSHRVKSTISASLRKSMLANLISLRIRLKYRVKEINEY